MRTGRYQPNRLYALRVTRGLSMAELGRRAGTSASQVNKIEKGRVKLNLEWMERFAGALGCRPVDLLFDAPQAATHIDTEILRHAIRVSEAVFAGEGPERMILMTDTIAANYDLLIEITRERGGIDEATIDTLIRTQRRIIARDL